MRVNWTEPGSDTVSTGLLHSFIVVEGKIVAMIAGNNGTFHAVKWDLLHTNTFVSPKEIPGISGD